jgi:glycosyltransferase involved in cell wall biosynthesis
MLLRLVTALTTRGYENVVVSMMKRDGLSSSFEKIGVPVHHLDMPRGMPDPRGLLRLASIFRREEPDVLQGWMYHANLATSLVKVARRSDVPLVRNIRRGLDDYAERKLAVRTLIGASARSSRFTQRIIYCSEESAAQHERVGFEPRKRMLIGNGFDTAKFRFRPDAPARMLTELGLEEDAVLIGNVGRADVAKGHTILIEAFAQVLFAIPSARLVLTGRGVDGSNEGLSALIRRRGLSSRVFMLGERPLVEELYPAFDCYCSSSIAEGFPNDVAEAMASGVPCTVTARTRTNRSKILARSNHRYLCGPVCFAHGQRLSVGNVRRPASAPHASASNGFLEC